MKQINTSENFPKNLKLYVFANFYEGKTILNRDSGAKHKNTVHRCYCFPRKIFLVTHQDSGRRCLGFESVSGRLPCIRFRYEGAATLFFFQYSTPSSFQRYTVYVCIHQQVFTLFCHVALLCLYHRIIELYCTPKDSQGQVRNPSIPQGVSRHGEGGGRGDLTAS